jgi:hypothetical protein
MDRLLSALHSTQGSQGEPTLESTALALLMAFTLGQLIAWVYGKTHRGVSYSRTFTQSLVLMTMVVALALHVIGNNIVTAFGLIGALAIIRFRNVLKDTRDTVFVFFALVLGMAVGVERYSASLVGTGGLLLATVLLTVTGFGSRGHFDGHLSLQLTGDADEDQRERVLARFCRHIRQISMRSSGAGDGTELVLRVRLRDRRRGPELIAALQGLAAVRRADLVLRDDLMEL